MSQRILVLGGGVGGTIVANILARTLHPREASITLVDSTGKHVYMPMWLYMPFQHTNGDSEQVVRNERDLLNKHVHLVQGQVVAIDPRQREVRVQHSAENNTIGGTGGAVDATYAYDYLVLATGARLVP